MVIKTNAAQHYTTDGPSAALFSEVCRSAGVPIQQFANRSDQPGGSTLGSISNTKVPLLTVDIGMAQLAMHSAYETAACADCDGTANGHCRELRNKKKPGQAIICTDCHYHWSSQDEKRAERAMM